MKIKAPLEKVTQLAICKYLHYRRHFFWRQNTGAILNHLTGKFKKMPKYALNGVPDILLVKDGVLYGLEVKRKGTYQSEDQKHFQTMLEKAGGKYYVVRSIEDVINIGL